MVLKKLLPHQGQFIQAPYVFPLLRFFFLIGGYACGKTSALQDAILHAIDYYHGKKDGEGKNPKIMVGGISLTFLRKTLTGGLEQILKNTKSEYLYDKAHNIMYVAGVELLLIPIQNEEDIFGYDCCFEGNTPVATENGQVAIKDITIGDYVYTRKGLRRVTHVWDKGERECIPVTVNGKTSWCTPDHKYIDVFNNEIEAQDLTKSTPLVILNDREVTKWNKELLQKQEQEKALNLMVSNITDTQKVNHMEKETTLPVLMKISKKATQRIIEIYTRKPLEKSVKSSLYITKMETLQTTELRTWKQLLNLTMQSYITMNGQMNGNINSTEQFLKLLQLDKKNLKNLNIMQSFADKDKNKLTKESTVEFVLSVAKDLLQEIQKLNTVQKNAIENRIKKLCVEQEKAESLMKSEPVKYAESSSPAVNTSLLQLAHLDVKTLKEEEQSRVCHVYDIEIEEEHNFFANNVLVHNCCAFIDELDELPTYNAMAVVKACNDRCRQIIPDCREPFLAFATTSQGLKGTYQTCMSFKNTGMPFMIIRGRTKDNTFLPKEYVASMYKIYNEKEIECLLEGKFISIDSGLVFPDYDPAKNKLDVDLYDTVTADDVVFIGQDFNGFGNYAMAMIIRYDSIVIIKEYKLPDMRRAPEVFRHDFPTADIVWIPDMTYKDHFSEFKKELHSYNIRIAYRRCNPLVNDRNFACNKLFHAEKLFICPICTMTDNGLMTHQKDKKTGAPMKGGDKAPDHLNDCLGYAVHYMLSWCRPLKPLYNVTLRYLYTKRADQGASKDMLESGYKLLDGKQLKGLGAPKKKHKKQVV